MTATTEPGPTAGPGVATVHAAPVVVPVASPPIPSGAVAVDGTTIVAVGTRDEILRGRPDAELVDWDGVLVPGLVNAHTHLQYTSFSDVGGQPYPHFLAWSERFVEEYEARAGEDWAAAARQGVELALRSGTTCFADVVTDRSALDVLVATGVAGVSYLELIGVDAGQWNDGVGDDVAAVLETTLRPAWAPLGLSPHALFSVDEPVLLASAALARRLGVRLHTHLAESDAEEALLRTATGPLADRVRARVARPWTILDRGGAGMGPGEFAQACGLIGPDVHMAHGVHLDAAERKLLRDTGTAVALCPRSNLTVGIGQPPVADYLREGNPIAVGTDSLGSSPSLDLLDDVARLRRLAVDGGYAEADLERRLLHAATLGGAAALGLDHLVGSLEPGKRADLAVFDVDTEIERVEHSLAVSGASRCIATVVAGRLRHAAG